MQIEATSPRLRIEIALCQMIGQVPSSIHSFKIAIILTYGLRKRSDETSYPSLNSDRAPLTSLNNKTPRGNLNARHCLCRLRPDIGAQARLQMKLAAKDTQGYPKRKSQATLGGRLSRQAAEGSGAIAALVVWPWLDYVLIREPRAHISLGSTGPFGKRHMLSLKTLLTNQSHVSCVGLYITLCWLSYKVHRMTCIH